MLQWFISFTEFNESSAPFRKNSIVQLVYKMIFCAKAPVRSSDINVNSALCLFYGYRVSVLSFLTFINGGHQSSCHSGP